MRVVRVTDLIQDEVLMNDVFNLEQVCILPPRIELLEGAAQWSSRSELVFGRRPIPLLRWSSSGRPSLRFVFIALESYLSILVPCSTGSFFSDGECRPCPIGQYQPLMGQVKCLACAEGLITPGLGAENATDCRGE